MPASMITRGSSNPFLLTPVELECSWCGVRVSFLSGENCGVCIECGTVMFRPPVKDDSPAARRRFTAGYAQINS